MGKDRGQSSIVLLPNLARSGSALPRNRLGLVRRDWGQSYSEIARVFGGSSVAAGVPRSAVPRDCEGNERGKTCLTQTETPGPGAAEVSPKLRGAFADWPAARPTVSIRYRHAPLRVNRPFVPPRRFLG